MPNAKVLSEKQAIVAALTEKLQNAKAGVLVDYSGFTVSEDTEMRRKLREANVEYAVVKNTLLRFAIDNVGLGELDGLLNGNTSLAISSEDPVAPAKISANTQRSSQTTLRSKAVSWTVRFIDLESGQCSCINPRSPRAPRPGSWYKCWLLSPPLL
jgi:large subunit ribosomal protein L10